MDWDKAFSDAVEANEHIAQNEGRWTAFWDGFAEQYRIEVLAERSLHQRVVEHLKCEGRFRRGDRVIDIGCGPGTYPLLMSGHAGRITCLDSSQGMLDKLGEEAARNRIGNLELRLGGWEDVPPERCYDLAMCVRSPAIRDRRGLLKMEEVSGRDCCYIAGVSKREEGKEWRDLWELADGTLPMREIENKVSYYVINPLNILLEEGRYPDLRFFFDTVDYWLDPGMVISNLKKSVQVHAELTRDKEISIEDRVLDRCEHGRFHVHGVRGLAVLMWKVPGA